MYVIPFGFVVSFSVLRILIFAIITQYHTNWPPLTFTV